MPRRGSIAKRDVLPDPLYNSKLVTRLINNIMYDGKKGVAQKIVYGAFDIIAEKTGNNPLEVFEQAMENVMPVLEVKARRVGGATYQVPMEKSLMPQTVPAVLSRSVKTLIRWLKLTRLSLITDGNFIISVY